MKKTLACIGFTVLVTSQGSVLAQTLPGLPGPFSPDYGEILSPEAEEGRRFRFAVGTDIAHDDNVFRLPAGFTTGTLGATGRTNQSTIARVYAQGNIDVPVSRQRFLAQATANAYSFSGLSYLNYNSLDFRGAWLWQAGNLWRGELRYDHLKGLTPFIDGRPVVQNLRTLDYAVATAEYSLTPRWSLTMGANGYDASNSDIGYQPANVRQATGELGVKYFGSGPNYIQALGAYSRGKYPDRIATPQFDDEYDQMDLGVEVFYGVSDLSFARGRLNYTSRTYPNVSERDFSGPTGRVEFVWGISPKTGINFNARRELGVFEDITTSYTLTDIVAVAPWWEVFPRVRLEATYERWWREYRGDPFALAAGRALREDDLSFVRFGVQWTPTRNWLLRIAYQYSTRDSNYPEFSFDDNLVFGTVEFRF
jgi:exopolysaccharide biosynthesis operon protein EpsL